MKKLVIATRFYHRDWYQQAFVNYYLSIGAAEIRIYCKKEDHRAIEQNLASIQSADRICIIPEMKTELRSFVVDWEMCKFIYADTLEAVENRLVGGDTFLVAFPDHDEFLDLNFILRWNAPGGNAFRTVFHEWYLPPSLIRADLSADMMLTMALEGQLKGKVLEMWGDPYYKDYVFAINAENLEFFKESYPLGGFHRLINQNKAWVPEVFDSIWVHHLKGIPDHHRRPILEYRKRISLEEQDDWVSWHFEQEYATLFEPYSHTYQSLETPAALANRRSALIQSFAPKESVFDQVVVRQNLDLDGHSRPSLFDLSKQLQPITKASL